MKLVFRAMLSIKLPIKKEDAMKITCRYCAKKKEVPAYEVKRGNGKFCSRSCASKYNYYQKNKHIIGGKKGKDNPNWKGGKTLCTKGYRMIYKPDHPYAHNGYIMEHRAVLEDVLGRYITPTEKVHHRDGNRLNNTPENLFLFPNNRLHSQYHQKKKKIPTLTEEKFMKLYIISSFEHKFPAAVAGNDV